MYDELRRHLQRSGNPIDSFHRNNQDDIKLRELLDGIIVQLLRAGVSSGGRQVHQEY